MSPLPLEETIRNLEMLYNTHSKAFLKIFEEWGTNDPKSLPNRQEPDVQKSYV